LSETDSDYRFPLLVLLNQTTCNTCGFSFNGKTGKSTTPAIVAWIAVPVVVVFALGWFLFWLLTVER
jgi:hypothetical protein